MIKSIITFVKLRKVSLNITLDYLINFMNLPIKDRTAIVTGGDSGIGLATAIVLAPEGVNVILNDKTHAELEKAAEEVRSFAKDNSVIAISADLTKNEKVEKLAIQTKKNLAVLKERASRHCGR